MSTACGHVAPDASGLRIERLCKRFGDFVAVADVDLHVRRGEFLTLLGPSGSGKTTLLLMLAGFVEPTSGDLRLDGRSIRSLAPEKREFGMVFQGYALFPHMTVRRNVAYPLEVRKQPRDAVRRRVDEMLELVQLHAFADRLPRQLSGGQQQRVALARALSFDPRVLLLDEPLGALDKKLRGEMQLQLKRLHRRIGTTFVYVTHDQEEALSMSDRVVIMNHGSTMQVGSPAELYERPATAFAASFLGESNFLRGVVTGRQAECATYTIAGREYRQNDPGCRLEDGARITLALRPEKLEVAPASECGSGPTQRQPRGAGERDEVHRVLPEPRTPDRASPVPRDDSLEPAGVRHDPRRVEAVRGDLGGEPVARDPQRPGLVGRERRRRREPISGSDRLILSRVEGTVSAR